MVISLDENITVILAIIMPSKMCGMKLLTYSQTLTGEYGFRNHAIPRLTECQGRLYK